MEIGSATVRAKGDERSDVASACRVLGASGQGDLIWGHVSLRDPDGRGAWIKASGWGLEEVTKAEVHLVDREGRVREGNGTPHIEYPIHTEVLAVRPDVHAVIHTHAVPVVAFASTNEVLRPISHDAALFAPPDIARFTLTGDLITTAELGAAVAAALGSREAVLLVNHGAVVVGENLATAVVRSLSLERACRTHLLAQAAGGPRLWSPDAEARSKRARHGSPRNLERAYEYLLRSLNR